MDAQIINAIEIAWDPSHDPNLKSQAFEYLNRLREESTAWQACLTIFTGRPPRQDFVRHFALEVVNIAVQTQLDRDSLVFVKENIMEYVHQTYSSGASPQDVDTAHIQNKLTQCITNLFTRLYSNGWETFFDDFRGLAGNSEAIGTTSVAATTLYLRILSSVHDEIGDVLLLRSAEEQKRSAELKDLIRARDAQKISLSWQEILGKWRQSDHLIVNLCLRNVGRWVSWTDISLIVNQSMLNVLFEIAGQQGIESSDSGPAKTRDAAIATFTEIVAKKMQPTDKIELITYLNLGTVVGQLIASPPLSQFRGTPNYDTDLAEAVAKLVNTATFDIVKVLDEGRLVDASLSLRTDELLQTFVPYVLRFFADIYDEVCSNVIPSLMDILAYFRKIVKTGTPLPDHYFGMLTPILEAVVGKMKYDDTATWGSGDDETDEAEFQELRKKLYVMQKTVATINENLYIDTIGNLVANILEKFNQNNQSTTWRDIDLALHEMYLLGDLGMKEGALYNKKGAISPASQRIINMMTGVIESDVASHPHPIVQLSFMELCNRYSTFFEHNQRLIPTVLEAFVRLSHAAHSRVRMRAWYLFCRFVKPLKSHLGDVSQTVVQAMSDLLTISAEVATDSNDNDMSSDANAKSDNAKFSAQLNLFEVIGIIVSTPSVPLENQVLLAQSIMNPLFSDIQQHLEPAKSGNDERAVLQIHHHIMALGTLARGFSDWNLGGSASVTAPPNEIAQEFERATEAILVALENLKSSFHIRTAARFAFSRLLGVVGSRMFIQLPRWINGLLSLSSSQDEMATFLRVLDQVVFAFKGEIFDILNELLTPLVQRVFAGLAEPTSGTDDEIQLVELRREYLNFLHVIMNNGLASVLVSPGNQPVFENIIGTVEHFSRDLNDCATARIAFQVLTTMVSVWGGPDVSPPSIPNIPAADTISSPVPNNSIIQSSTITSTNGTHPSNPRQSTATTVPTPQPTLPGFDSFAITRFSPLTWALPSSPQFNPNEPLARQVIAEAALLQLEILRKTGAAYVEALTLELKAMGAAEPDVQRYVEKLLQASVRDPAAAASSVSAFATANAAATGAGGASGAAAKATAGDGSGAGGSAGASATAERQKRFQEFFRSFVTRS